MRKPPKNDFELFRNLVATRWTDFKLELRFKAGVCRQVFATSGKEADQQLAMLEKIKM